jgi:acetoacetyl-CoA synthetase
VSRQHKTDPVWQPDPRAIDATHMRRFMQQAGANNSVDLADWESLYAWSLAEPADFWAAVADYAGVIFARPPAHVLVHGEQMQDARWFDGSLLNFAENLLELPDSDGGLVFRDERGRRLEVDRAQLRNRVAALAAALRAAGIKPGDRVAALLPNCPEAVVVMLGAASVGAVFSSCSPEFGETAVVERFGQIEPRILFACDGHNYGGKRHGVIDKVERVAAAVSGIEQIVVVPFAEADPDISSLPSALLFDDFLIADSELVYAPLPFDHPLYILFSSGTTGKPKCIVHGAGGTLLQHLKEQLLHTDISAADTLFYYTTCGWMMWNWLVSGLATGAKLVLYDGSPTHPDPGALWRMAEEEGVSVFGTSPKYLVTVEKSGAVPGSEHDLTALRSILSTGAPLPAASYDFVTHKVSDRVQLSSISGGTDIISCFALGNPLLPVYRGELQSRGLGMAVAVFNDAGEAVTGEPGELVCTLPFPSMPVSFWNDPDGSLYHAAYFERFPGVWAHGDVAELTGDGGLIIHGRADATLNPGGVRIGTAEVCNPAMLLDEISDCIAVGQRWQDDVRIVLFVVLQDGTALDEGLQARVRASIRTHASPRHVPAVIAAVPEIPRTLSGKPVELAVRAVIHDEVVDNLDAIANPVALAAFSHRPELSAD